MFKSLGKRQHLNLSTVIAAAALRLMFVTYLS
jgi:hypothetical protein